jgi:hypothetical protein
MDPILDVGCRGHGEECLKGYRGLTDEDVCIRSQDLIMS